MEERFRSSSRRDCIVKTIHFFYRALVLPIFRSVSPIEASCRFIPSCSHYSRQMFLEESFCFALWASLKRVIRCNPFGGGLAYDPPSGRKVNSGISTR